jgi:hypothetical protein
MGQTGPSDPTDPTGTTGPTGTLGPTGIGFVSQIGSFISESNQYPNALDPETVPVAITFSSRTEGAINVSGGSYPNSQVVIPVSGIYRFLFSAQCVSTGSHSIEI